MTIQPGIALEIILKDKNISEVLDMTVSEALEFLWNFPRLRTKYGDLRDVGLLVHTSGCCSRQATLSGSARRSALSAGDGPVGSATGKTKSKARAKTKVAAGAFQGLLLLPVWQALPEC